MLDPCNKDSFITHSGARGTVIPYLYAGCSKPSGNQSIVDAVMVGMDHILGTFNPEIVHAPGASAGAVDATPAARVDGANGCAPFPNTVEIDTGFTAQLLVCALLENPCVKGTSATSGLPGRLSTPSSEATFAGLNVDDNALWDFMVANPPTTPESCTAAKNGSTPFYRRRAAMSDCLQNWTPSMGPLFTDAVGESKRFGFVPRIAERCLYDAQPADPKDCSSPALKNAHINGFDAVYMDGLYQDKGGTCDAGNPATPTPSGSGWSIHYPGKDMKCGSADKVHRVSAVIIPCGALPESVCDPSDAGPFPDPLGLNKVRLAK
jgi:hypothetical protein